MAQLASDSEELHQVVSSILRNLSWRADVNSKRVLRDIGCVSALMTCALQATKVPLEAAGVRRQRGRSKCRNSAGGPFFLFFGHLENKPSATTRPLSIKTSASLFRRR